MATSGLQEMLILLLLAHFFFSSACKLLNIPQLVHISNGTNYRTSYIPHYRSGNNMKFDSTCDPLSILVVLGSPTHHKNIDGCYKPGK